MGTIMNQVKEEINRLRELKKSLFENDFDKCDMEVSDICLSADVLLVPLYWYYNNNKIGGDNLKIETYLIDSVNSFGPKVKETIPRLLTRVREIDNQYPSRPLKSYCKILSRCYSEFSNDNQIRE